MRTSGSETSQYREEKKTMWCIPRYSPSSGERKGNSPNRSITECAIDIDLFIDFVCSVMFRGCKAVSLVLREKLQNVCIEKVVGNQHHSG